MDDAAIHKLSDRGPVLFNLPHLGVKVTEKARASR
jgi:N-formylglutamate amidohydrolase